MIDMQRAIYKEAKRRGLNPSRLTAAEYQRINLAVRDFKTKVKDGAKAIESRVVTSIGFRCVPLVVYEARQQQCFACEYYRKLEGGEPACDRCGCSNKFLEAKWQDARQKCPIGKWDDSTDQQSS